MSRARLELDHLAPRRSVHAAGIALLVLAVATSGLLLREYAEVVHAMEGLESSAALVLRTPGVAKRVPEPNLDDERKAVRSVYERLTLPWAGVIKALEEASSGQVAILQIQPEAPQRLLRITAEARTEDAMFDYVRKLSTAKGLSEVHVVSHQLHKAGSQRVVQFSAHASFRHMQ
jgi:hypothetical protein